MINILLLEDNLDDARYFIRRCLSNSDFDVVHCTTLTEAIAPDTEVPEIILSDLYLPDSKGISTIEALRKRFPETPLIALTGDTNLSDSEKAVKIGAYNYIEKEKIDHRTLSREIGFALERSKLESQLKQAKFEAERHSDFKSNFLAHFSHEIRTPLNAIVGATNLLLEEDLNDSLKELVESQRLGCERLLIIVNDILDISKIESGKIELEEKPFEIRTLIRECMQIYAAKAENAGVLLSDFVSPKIPSQMVGDPNRVKQILTNYISNAIKYAPHNPLHIKASLVDNKILVEVKDNGEGLSKKARRKLFIPFSQSNIMHAIQGTGLGLVVCKQLAELMGGDAGVKSKVGAGSNFWFSFTPQKLDFQENTRKKDHPLRVLLLEDSTVSDVVSEQLKSRNIILDEIPINQFQGQDGYDIVIVDALNSKKKQVLKQLGSETPANTILICQRGTKSLCNVPRLVSPFSHHSTMNAIASLMGAKEKNEKKLKEEQPCDFNGIKALIVDDDPLNQKVLAKMLYPLGIESNVASNGLEALEKTKENHYDVIFMDCSMPVMDGYEASQKIKSADNNQFIVALTGKVYKEDRDKCLKSGMDFFLPKPIEKSELNNALHYLSSNSKKI